ncbi:hypothetical protein LX32DRAFT_633526, partial [Colletotrichum zoysiae]
MYLCTVSTLYSIATRPHPRTQYIQQPSPVTASHQTHPASHFQPPKWVPNADVPRRNNRRRDSHQPVIVPCREGCPLGM